MSDGPHFSCEECGKSFAWKPEIAGRKAKCKCGAVLLVPAESPETALEDLYDLVPSGPVEEPAAARIAMPAPVVAASSGKSASLPYQRGPTARERERNSVETLMDMKRDVYIPVALLVGGLLIYVLYYALRYHMSGAGIAIASFGIGLMTVFKATLLIGFAFVVAGPLGVSFGGIWTAALKLAAIAVFCDGVCTWVDAGIAKAAAGFGAGILSFPVAIAIYWTLLIYLFSMDPGDSWLVVCLLAVFDSIVRWIMIAILLSVVLGWGGVSTPSLPGAARSASADPMAVEVQEMIDTNRLQEAKAYITKAGNKSGYLPFIDGWYANGAKNVWCMVTTDFDGKNVFFGLTIEMPKNKDKRAAIYESLPALHEFMGRPMDEDHKTDTGETYLSIEWD